MKEIDYHLDGTLIIALSRSLRTAHQKSEALFREHHLTMAQFTVLEALYHKGGLTVGELIEAVLSTSGNMTVVIRNLEQSGLVSRTVNPSDGRSFLVCLTDSGRELIANVFKKHMALVGVALSPITAEEKETIIKILKKLR